MRILAATRVAESILLKCSKNTGIQADRGGEVASLILLFFLFQQSAKSTALSGIVRATQRLGIAGAEVTANCTSTAATTDERGAFVLPGVKGGCVLNIRAAGFAPSRYTVLDPAGPIEISMGLDP